MKRYFLLLLLPFLLTACVNQTPQTKEIFAMDTVMQLSATGENASDALTAAVESINKADSLWSEQREGSDIYRLNQAKAGERRWRSSRSTHATGSQQTKCTKKKLWL